MMEKLVFETIEPEYSKTQIISTTLVSSELLLSICCKALLTASSQYVLDGTSVLLTTNVLGRSFRMFTTKEESCII